jgi:hypothetical protein
MYPSFVTMTTLSLSLALSAAEPASTVFDPDASCFMPGKAESKNRGDDKERVREKKRVFAHSQEHLRI